MSSSVLYGKEKILKPSWMFLSTSYLKFLPKFLYCV